MYAAFLGDVVCAQTLLRFNADINVRDEVRTAESATARALNAPLAPERPHCAGSRSRANGRGLLSASSLRCRGGRSLSDTVR